MIYKNFIETAKHQIQRNEILKISKNLLFADNEQMKIHRVKVFKLSFLRSSNYLSSIL